MKITVATVCYNAGDCIRKTIESVINQTYADIEYLIIDGASSDDTMLIVKGYVAEDDRIKTVSEPDEGLYDAMNKAACMASGDYIIYMNAGDTFASSTALKETVKMIENASGTGKYPDVVYGNVIRIKPDSTYVESYRSDKPLLKLLLTGNIPSHQSTLTKTAIIREYGFDLSYSITADFDFYVRAYASKLNIRYLRVTIGCVDNTVGLSSDSNNLEIMRSEDDRSLRQNLPLWYYLTIALKKAYRLFKRHKI